MKKNLIAIALFSSLFLVSCSGNEEKEVQNEIEQEVEMDDAALEEEFEKLDEDVKEVEGQTSENK